MEGAIVERPLTDLAGVSPAGSAVKLKTSTSVVELSFCTT